MNLRKARIRGQLYADVQDERRYRQAYCIYEYQPNRKAEHPKEFLKEFSGFCTRTGIRDTMRCRKLLK